MFKIPNGYKLEQGMLWPKFDTDCARVIFDMAKDLDAVWPFVKDYSACVQAGGNCGLWPRLLAMRFGAVYTAEPHPANFAALTWNTMAFPGVVRFQAAFGYDPALVSMTLDDGELNNCGAFYVQPGGFIPTIRIDHLGLPKCGLIYLDIEGKELEALRGAIATIDRCRPVIVLEDKGLSERYGVAKGDAERYLDNVHGYTVAARIHRDVILVPPQTLSA